MGEKTMYLVHALFALFSLFTAPLQQTGCDIPGSWVGHVSQSLVSYDWEINVETNNPDGGFAFYLEENANPANQWVPYLWSGQPQTVKNLQAYSWSIMQNQTPSCPSTPQLNAWKTQLLKMKFAPTDSSTDYTCTMPSSWRPNLVWWNEERWVITMWTNSPADTFNFVLDQNNNWDGSVDPTRPMQAQNLYGYSYDVLNGRPLKCNPTSLGSWRFQLMLWDSTASNPNQPQ